MLRSRSLRICLPFLFLSFFWELVSQNVKSTLFPGPLKVGAAFVELILLGGIFLHISESLWRVFVGLVIGSVLGIAIGLVTGRNSFVHRSIGPVLHFFRSFPPVAIIPLVIVWLGIGDIAKIFSISFGVFFPVWVNTHVGSSRISVDYIRACMMLTRSGIKKWLYVFLPASLPFIVTGVRIGISIAYIMVYVSELAGASSGLGYLISVSHLAYRIDRMIVGLMLLGFLGLLTDLLLVRCIRRLFPWLIRC
jgi:ABC-type nitrate/sulfonate/bicarbonate transport system permease component